MSYTAIDLVAHYLTTPYPVAQRVEDQPVTLHGTIATPLFGGAIIGSSVVVKSLRSVRPERTDVTLSTSETAFAAGPIVSNMVVVAGDSSMGDLYRANEDYVIDSASGTIKIKTDGRLAPGDQVFVWYVPLVTYQSGEDYSVSSDSSELRRLSAGGIADGETVLVDYTPAAASPDDSLVAYAVTTANGLIEHEVDPARQFDAHPALVAAATYRALEIIARATAGRQLLVAGGNDRAAGVWLDLSESYAGLADRFIREFHPPTGRLQAPVRV